MLKRKPVKSQVTWREIKDEREKYSAYLCSREWSVLKEAVKKRSGGKCERCKVLDGDAVHHLTYERKYAETLDDLQHICNPCHEFTHGKSDFDPAEYEDILTWLLWNPDKRPLPVELMYDISEPSVRSLTCIRASEAIDKLCRGTQLCIGTLLSIEDALADVAGFKIPPIHMKNHFSKTVHPANYVKACAIVGLPSAAMPGDLAPDEE